MFCVQFDISPRSRVHLSWFNMHFQKFGTPGVDELLGQIFSGVGVFPWGSNLCLFHAIGQRFGPLAGGLLWGSFKLSQSFARVAH